MKNSNNILSKSELKSIVGGNTHDLMYYDEGAACEDECQSGNDCTSPYSCYEVTFKSGNSCNRCILPAD